MNQSPYFTIIIPTLNEERYLPRLLKNLQQQTFTDFEVFVVDGYSEDKTPQLVANYPAHYQLNLIQTKTRNVSHQRNLGAQHAQGKVLIFFDADSQIPKIYLEKVYHTFETKRPHVLTTWIKADTNHPSDRFIATASNLLMEVGKVIGSPACFGAMTAIKKGAFDDIGGYDEQTPFGEDRQIIMTATDYHYQFMILPKPAYVYSLRRFRSEGTLDTVLETLKINLSIISKGYHLDKVNYPMGGHVFVKDSSQSPATDWMNSLSRRLKKTSREQRQTISRLFDRFFPES